MSASLDFKRTFQYSQALYSVVRISSQLFLIYNNGMSGGQFGFQSANAVIFFIVIVVISVLQMTITGKKEEQL